MLFEKAEPFRSGRVSGIICGIALLWRLNCAGAHSAETGRFHGVARYGVDFHARWRLFTHTPRLISAADIMLCEWRC